VQIDLLRTRRISREKGEERRGGGQREAERGGRRAEATPTKTQIERKSQTKNPENIHKK
jgi:hypothetical protein